MAPIQDTSVGVTPHSSWATSAAITKEMSPTSMASSAQPMPDPTTRRPCSRVKGSRSSRAARGSGVSVAVTRAVSDGGALVAARRRSVAPAQVLLDAVDDALPAGEGAEVRQWVDRVPEPFPERRHVRSECGEVGGAAAIGGQVGVPSLGRAVLDQTVVPGDVVPRAHGDAGVVAGALAGELGDRLQ